MSPINWAIFKPNQKKCVVETYGHGGITELRNKLNENKVQYGLMRLSFGEGRFRRSWWVFFLWSPQNMKNKIVKSKHVSWQNNMRNKLKPWSVAIEAAKKEFVTISEWILRVRKTVVVDGNDDISEESFRKALEAEERFIKEQRELEERQRQERIKREEEERIRKMKEETQKRYAKAETIGTAALYDKQSLKKVKGKPVGLAESSSVNDDDIINESIVVVCVYGFILMFLVSLIYQCVFVWY